MALGLHLGHLCSVPQVAYCSILQLIFWQIVLNVIIFSLLLLCAYWCFDFSGNYLNAVSITDYKTFKAINQIRDKELTIFQQSCWRNLFSSATAATRSHLWRSPPLSPGVCMLQKRQHNNKDVLLKTSRDMFVHTADEVVQKVQGTVCSWNIYERLPFLAWALVV